MRGWPGVGKTDLLRATGRDARITAHFAGGVLYAELGPTPSPSSILRRWIAELGHQAPQSDDPETLAAVVRAALRDRRALLILDDVWESSLGAARALRRVRLARIAGRWSAAAARRWPARPPSALSR